MADPWGPGKSNVLYGGVVVESERTTERVHGGWFEEQTFAEVRNAFNPHETGITDYRFKESPAFYDDFLAEYNENEWYGWLVDQLVAALFSGYDFRGPGADAVRKFFDDTCPDARDQVMQMGLNVVREGTGGMRKFKNGSGRLVQIYALNGRLIRLREGSSSALREGYAKSGEVKYNISTGLNIEPSSGQGESLTDHSDAASEPSPADDIEWVTRMTMRNVTDWHADFIEWPRRTVADYTHPEVALCRIRRDRWSPYGIMFGRSCFHVIKSMRSLNRDLIASIKRLAATLLIFKAELGNISGDTNKLAALEKVSKAFADIDAATTGVIAIDNKNSIEYPSGTRADRLIPIMEQLEPVMSALLLNFLVALGIVEQTGANKSLVAKQEIRARKQLREYQAAVARFFKMQVFPEITDEPCEMVFDTELDPEYWLGLWQTGAVSRERVTDEFSIIDEGSTFVPFKTPGAGASVGSRAADSNDDETAPGRRGTQGDTSVEKGGK